MVRELEENEANNKLNLTPEFAAHFDISAAAMILVQGYVPIETGRLREAWLHQLETAAKSAETMYNFLCQGLAKGVKPQQTHALFRRADMLHRLLGVAWRNQPTADEVLHHAAFTLSSHTDALLLQLDSGIRMEGGFGIAPKGCWWEQKKQPAVLFKTDGSNGTGVVACEDVVAGEHLGQYAGRWVSDSALVTVAELPVSRYTVSRVTNQHREVGCVLGNSDFEWCILHASAGSFMNAGTKDNEVNVVMDRTKAWTDDSDICWIPMKAGAQGVKTGQRFVYYYFCSFKLAGVTNYFY